MSCLVRSCPEPFQVKNFCNPGKDPNVYRDVVQLLWRRVLLLGIAKGQEGQK
jgi:hypothetical protein